MLITINHAIKVETRSQPLLITGYNNNFISCGGTIFFFTKHVLTDILFRVLLYYILLDKQTA